MRIDIEEAGTTVLLVISHGKDRYAMDLSDRTTSRAVYTNMMTTYTYNNTDIWPQMDESVQRNLYELIIAGIELARSPLPLENVIMALRGVVQQIASHHDETKMRLRIGLSPTITMPASISDRYNREDGNPGSEEQTYVRSEYLDLLTLSCGLKAVLPILIEMKYKSFQSVGAALMDGRQFDILTRSEYLNYKGMAKLVRYITVFMDKSHSDEVRMANVVAGIGSEGTSRQILAKQVVSTVILMDPITGQIPNTSAPGEREDGSANTQTVISRIYFSVSSMVHTGSRGRRGSLVEPKFPSGTGNSDEATSTLEQYRSGLSSNQGDLAAVRYYMEQHQSHLFQLFGGQHQGASELLEIFLSHGNANRRRSILPCQRRIVKAVYQDLIDPRHIDCLKKRQNIIAVAVTQTWLWVHGYRTIAAMVGATPVTESHVAMDNARDRIKDPDLLAKLNNLFIPAKRIKGKGANAVVENRVMTAIMALNNPTSESDPSGFGSNAWRLHLPPVMRAELTGHEDATLFMCPRDVCVQLAQLFVQLAA
jgi:hypothetical protein